MDRTKRTEEQVFRALFDLVGAVEPVQQKVFDCVLAGLAGMEHAATWRTLIRSRPSDD